MGKKTETLAYFLSGFLCGLIVTIIGYVVGTDGYLISDIAEILYPVIIQVNATLIGFWGVVFVYVLKGLTSMRNKIFDYSMKNTEKCELLLKEVKQCKDKKTVKDAKEQIMGWIKTNKEYDKVMDSINNKISAFSLLGIIVVICFLASVLLSIIALCNITEKGIEVIWIQISIFPLMFGVTCSFIGIWASTPSTRKKGVKEKQINN
jgi:hypothetical protein